LEKRKIFKRIKETKDMHKRSPATENEQENQLASCERTEIKDEMHHNRNQ
jgi:hypothetical protein